MVDWQSFFDRVYIINLRRRIDRWEEFQQQLHQSNWPFKFPERFDAIDGKFCRPPAWWKQGAGAWGCYRSHLRIIEECLTLQVESVLILEDDAALIDGFAEKAQIFLEHVPEDWDMLYFGGQHLWRKKQEPIPVNLQVVRAYNVNRTHAYAVRRKMLPILYAHLQPSQWHNGHHIDHHYGVLHERQEENIYAPTNWLIGQNEGVSSISGKRHELLFWNSDEEDDARPTCESGPIFVAILGLYSSGSSCLAGVLHHLGLHLGDSFTGYYGSNPETNCSFEAAELAKICESMLLFPDTEIRQESKHVTTLRDWILQAQKEAVAKNAIAVGKHPLLCRLGEELLEICGVGLRIISIDRPMSESLESIVRRSPEHSPHEIKTHQSWLAEGKAKTLENVFHKLRINYADLLSRPEFCINRICHFLQLRPTPEQIKKAIAWVKPEIRHVFLNHPRQSVDDLHKHSLQVKIT